MEKLSETQIAQIAKNNLTKATGAMKLTRQEHAQLEMDLDFLYNKSLEAESLKKSLEDANTTIAALQDK